MTMTKEKLVESIRQELRFSKTRSDELFESVLEIIKENLEQGEDILISGVGKFYLNDKNERPGRNPTTAEEIMVSARRVVRFRASGNLRRAMNGGDRFS